MNETIPQHLLQYYGIVSNSSVNFGILVVSWVSLILPTNDASVDEKYKDNKWRIVYSFPLLIHVICYIFIFVSLKNPSLKELILSEKTNDNEVFKEIRKIYHVGKDLDNSKT